MLEFNRAEFDKLISLGLIKIEDYPIYTEDDYEAAHEHLNGISIDRSQFDFRYSDPHPIVYWTNPVNNKKMWCRLLIEEIYLYDGCKNMDQLFDLYVIIYKRYNLCRNIELDQND